MQANWPSRLKRETPSRSVKTKPSPLAVASEDGRTASPGPSPAGTKASRNSPSRLKTRIHGGDSSRIRTSSPRMTASRGLRRSDNHPACSTSPNVEITPTSSQVRAACVSTHPFSEAQDAMPRRPATITNRDAKERYLKSASLPGGPPVRHRTRNAAGDLLCNKHLSRRSPTEGVGFAAKAWRKGSAGEARMRSTGAISRSATPPYPQDRNAPQPVQRASATTCPYEAKACAKSEL